MKRNKFTFYESWYEVLQDLQPEDQAAVVMAMAAYALEDKEPELEGLPAKLFALIRLGIDSEREEAPFCEDCTMQEEAEESGQPEEEGVLFF